MPYQESIFNKVLDTDKVKPYTIKDFFLKEDNQLFIPDYQRPYSWEKNNVEEYIKDIFKIINGENDSWFLGTIFVTKKRENGNNDGGNDNSENYGNENHSTVTDLNLLDGQQRITTIQILLWSLLFIRRFYSSHVNLDDLDEGTKTEYTNTLGNYTCLVNSNNEPRYITHNQMNTEWTRFIKAIITISDAETDGQNKIETFIKDFKKKLATLAKGGQPSAKMISFVLTFTWDAIQDYFFNQIVEENEENEESIKRINIIEEVNTEIDKVKREIIEAGSEPTPELINQKLNRETLNLRKENSKDFALKYIKIISAVIDKSWILKISLKDKNSSLKIFESLNNRGKTLSLSDKLRYKCLISINGQTNQDTVFSDWKDIYTGLDLLKTKSLISNENDFFKAFLNSHSEDDYDSKDQIMTYFEDEYLKDDVSILRFCTEVKKVIRYNHFLIKIHNDTGFLTSRNSAQLDKIKALFALFRHAIFLSTNSRLMFYSTIREYYEFENDDIDDESHKHQLIFQTMWNIIKIILLREVIENEQSNNARVEYLKYRVPLPIPEEISSRISLIRITDVVDNLIFSQSAAKATFLLYLTSYIKNHGSLIRGSIVVEKSSMDREHVLPGAWGEHWPEMEVADSILNEKNGIVDKAELFNLSNEDSSKVKNSIKENPEFNLTKNINEGPKEVVDKSKSHSKRCVGNMIGNMVIIHKKLNRSYKNREFSFKKEELGEDMYISVPSKDFKFTITGEEQTTYKNIGLTLYNQWGFKEIIERSFLIYHIISSIWGINWDNID